MAGPTDQQSRARPHRRAVLVVALIYIFLVGVSMLESGIKVMGADTQASLFESVNNPIAGLFVGILGTVLVQSSSASTSVVVGLVASGALGVDAAVPMIMGANIGTTVTNTLVSLGSIRQSDEFKRAFADRARLLQPARRADLAADRVGHRRVVVDRRVDHRSPRRVGRQRVEKPDQTVGERAGGLEQGPAR